MRARGDLLILVNGLTEVSCGAHAASDTLRALPLLTMREVKRTMIAQTLILAGVVLR